MAGRLFFLTLRAIEVIEIRIAWPWLMRRVRLFYLCRRKAKSTDKTRRLYPVSILENFGMELKVHNNSTIRNRRVVMVFSVLASSTVQ